MGSTSVLGLSLGCSGGNPATFSESGPVFMTVDQDLLTDVLATPKLSAVEIEAMEKMSVTEVLTGPDLKIPPGASIVVGGTRIPNFDKIYSQWQVDVAQLSKEYKTWGALRAAVKRQMASLKSKSVKNGKVNRSAKSGLSPEAEADAEAENQLQLLDDDIPQSPSKGLLETLKNSCAAHALAAPLGITWSVRGAHIGSAKVAEKTAELANVPWVAARAATAEGMARAERQAALNVMRTAAVHGLRSAKWAARATPAVGAGIAGLDAWLAWRNCWGQKSSATTKPDEASANGVADANVGAVPSAGAGEESPGSSQPTNKGRHLMWQQELTY